MMSLLFTLALLGQRPESGTYEGVSHNGTSLSVTVVAYVAVIELGGPDEDIYRWDPVNGEFDWEFGSISFTFTEFSLPDGGSIWFWEESINTVIGPVVVDWGQMARS